MSKEIKEIKNDLVESIYQIGEGKNQLHLSVSTYLTDYRTREGENPNEYHFGSAQTDCVELKLSSENKNLYTIKQKGHEDAYLENGNGTDSYVSSCYVSEKKVDIREKLAENLYKDGSDMAMTVKDILLRIKGHPLLDEIKKNMSVIHEREVSQAREKRLKELNNSKLAKIRNKAAKIADKGAEILGLGKTVKKLTGGRKIADVELNSKAKAVEKFVSDKICGKVKE